MAQLLPGAPDGYICGDYYIEYCTPNPDWQQFQLYDYGGGMNDWSADTGQDPPEPEFCEYVLSPHSIPCCGDGGSPFQGCGDVSYIAGINFDHPNDIRWYDGSTQGGLNSVAPVDNFANQNLPQGAWEHNEKQTKFITELIAMDWGKGDFSYGYPSAIGMDYRHRSYDGIASSEEGGYATYVDEMGWDSNFYNSIIEQSPSISSSYVNTFAGSNDDYCFPPPPGGWIQDIKDLTRTHANFDFGCYPSEFISCSGFNQKNCSLAARMRQIYADEKADLGRGNTTSWPLDQGAQNWRPIVFTNNNLLAWDNSNYLYPNENVNGGTVANIPSTLPLLHEFMQGIDLTQSTQTVTNKPLGVSEFTAGEKGFPMGFFFNVAKFIVQYDDDTTDSSVNQYGGITQEINRTYRLKAGFKFIKQKSAIPGYYENQIFALNGAIDPDNGSGIHLGGHNSEWVNEDEGFDGTNPYED